MRGVGIDLIERAPEPQRPVADGQARTRLQTRALRSRSTSSQDSVDSRRPSRMATHSWVPSAVTPMITSRQSWGSSLARNVV